jgi:hypothetical protein
VRVGGDEGAVSQSPSLEASNMYRFIVALGLVFASTAASSAQGTFPSIFQAQGLLPSILQAQGVLPSIWQSERGAILKVLSIDSATGNFSGIFLSDPTGTCPRVPYDLVGRVLRGHQVVFQTSRTWTSDCAVTAVWSGRAVSQGTIATRWIARYIAPNGRVARTRGTETFKRI